MLLPAVRMKTEWGAVPALGGIPLLAKLGQGGMGAVYYGIHPRLNKEVAVKVLPFHLAEQQPELIQRFFREAQMASKVQSPHLVGVLDVNKEGSLFYLVMEFVNGPWAGRCVEERRAQGAAGLEEAVALVICIAAAEGLRAAHEEGVIHRDLKPDNIMIPRTKDGTGLLFRSAKLADLGLARGEELGASLTGAHACMGSPGYMAPEQAMDAKNAAKASDVFSLGATLYALLAGHAPFTGTTLLQVLLATAKEQPAPLHNIRPEVTPATLRLLERCLSKEPGLRFADGAQLLEALQACRQGEHVAGATVSAATPQDAEREPVLGYPLWLAAGVLVGLLLGWANWAKPFPVPLQAFFLGLAVVLLAGWFWKQRRVKQWEQGLGITLDRKPDFLWWLYAPFGLFMYPIGILVVPLAGYFWYRYRLRQWSERNSSGITLV